MLHNATFPAALAPPGVPPRAPATLPVSGRQKSASDPSAAGALGDLLGMTRRLPDAPLNLGDGVPLFAGAAATRGGRAARFVPAGPSPTENDLPKAALEALDRIGDLLWGKGVHGAQTRATLELRDATLKALGGRETALGSQFLRRYQAVSKTTWKIAGMERGIRSAVRRRNPETYTAVIEGIVTEELARYRFKAVTSLIHGNAFHDTSGAALKKRIQCRIDAEKSCMFAPFKWLVSNLWC